MSTPPGIWPNAELDPVRRMRILVAALPGAALRECVLSAPFDDVWRVASDLEVGTPLWELNVAALTVLKREEDQLEVEIRSPFGIRLRARAELRPGWCVMQGRLFTVGMAAVPEGERTRFGHFEVLNLPGAGILRPLLCHRIQHEFETLERLAQLVSRK